MKGGKSCTLWLRQFNILYLNMYNVYIDGCFVFAIVTYVSLLVTVNIYELRTTVVSDYIKQCSYRYCITGIF